MNILLLLSPFILMACCHLFARYTTSRNVSRWIWVPTFIMGIVWSISYIYCDTLAWAYWGHVLVDLGNLAVPVYMNLYVPNHKRHGTAQHSQAIG